MKFADLLPYVMPEVPGANVIAVERAILNAAREFCRQTWVWTHQPTVTIRAGRTYATLAPRIPAKSAVCGLDGWESEDTSIAPSLRNGDTELFVDDAPAADTRYVLTLALFPSRTADEMPDWLAGAHRDAITAHAKHEIMLLPEKTWTNPGRAQVLYTIFSDAVNEAKRNRNISRLRGRMRMRVPGVR